MEHNVVSGWTAGLALGLLVVALGCARPDGDAGAEPTRVRQTGLASYYGPGFHGRRTASGTRFNQHAMTAAHRTLPLGTRVRVTNLENGESVVLLITDRGPYGQNRRKGAIIDVSKAAAQRLDFVDDGLTRVRVDTVD